jgi:hypothetical protein
LLDKFIKCECENPRLKSWDESASGDIVRPQIEADVDEEGTIFGVRNNQIKNTIGSPRL